jgi:hypothetical protein
MACAWDIQNLLTGMFDVFLIFGPEHKLSRAAQFSSHHPSLTCGPRGSVPTRARASDVPPLSGPPLSSAPPFLPLGLRVAASRGPLGSLLTVVRDFVVSAPPIPPYALGKPAELEQLARTGRRGMVARVLLRIHMRTNQLCARAFVRRHYRRPPSAHRIPREAVVGPSFRSWVLRLSLLLKFPNLSCGIDDLWRADSSPENRSPTRSWKSIGHLSKSR